MLTIIEKLFILDVCRGSAYLYLWSLNTCYKNYSGNNLVLSYGCVFIISEKVNCSCKSWTEVAKCFTNQLTCFYMTGTLVVYELQQIACFWLAFILEVQLKFVSIKLNLWVTFCVLRQVIFPILTHFQPMFPFYILWKHQKTKAFLVFSGGIKWEHLALNGLMFIRVFNLIFEVFKRISEDFKTFLRCKIIQSSIFLNRHLYAFSPWLNLYKWKID